MREEVMEQCLSALRESERWDMLSLADESQICCILEYATLEM